MLSGLSWKQLIFILWVYIRKCSLKSSRITNLESLWYKVMRWYLWAWKLSLKITWMQHNAILPKAKGDKDSREWDGWMASPSQWTWTWANSGRWWGTGRSGVLQFMGSQRVEHDLVTEQQQQFLPLQSWRARIRASRQRMACSHSSRAAKEAVSVIVRSCHGLCLP